MSNSRRNHSCEGWGERHRDGDRTPRGPVVSPALGGDWPPCPAAVYLDPMPSAAFSRPRRARLRRGTARCFEQWPALRSILTYADTGGNIGWQLVGEAPRRKKANGTIPMPGLGRGVRLARGSHSVRTRCRTSENPPEGFSATANNPPVGLEQCRFSASNGSTRIASTPFANPALDDRRLDRRRLPEFAADSRAMPARHPRPAV